MRARHILTHAALVAACIPAIATAQASARATQDWASIDGILGRHGSMHPGGVMKYGFPRSDLQVTVDGVPLRPSLALGSWVAFRSIGPKQAMAMGDLVLAEDEVDPVMRALQAGGVEITAVHNHLLHESPRIMYMHVAAHGEAATIATAVRKALGASHTPLGAPAAAAAPTRIDLDTAAIARALGATGKVNGGVYQVSVPRRETIHERGHEVPAAMGVATAINFQPTGNGRAAITGDIVMRASEVNAVIRALHAGGITITALHSHMLDDEPRLFFMHFWANADAVTLAQALHEALSQTRSRLR